MPPGVAVGVDAEAQGHALEDLLDPYDVARQLRRAGLRASVQPGFYSAYLGRRGLVAGVLNRAIAHLGPIALTVAPYYVVEAERPSAVATPS